MLCAGLLLRQGAMSSPWDLSVSLLCFPPTAHGAFWIYTITGNKHSEDESNGDEQSLTTLLATDIAPDISFKYK